MLKLAIEQYEQIVKLDPESTEDHLLLGRLYKVNNDLQKAESEFKTAVALQPDRKMRSPLWRCCTPKRMTFRARHRS